MTEKNENNFDVESRMVEFGVTETMSVTDVEEMREAVTNSVENENTEEGNELPF